MTLIIQVSKFKNGASSVFRDQQTEFNFEDKLTDGIATTFQVQRGRFDGLLAHEAARMEDDICWQMLVTAVDFSGDQPKLEMRDPSGNVMNYEADFILGASGFGRFLPWLLDPESPSGIPVRKALFGHIEDRFGDGQFDRNKIRITVHPEHKDVWYWLIPFSNGRSSIFLLTEAGFYQAWDDDNDTALRDLINQDVSLRALLKNVVFDDKINAIIGYSANVKSLYGKGYALLGNAGEFLDPVFFSGVTIAVKSASLAAAVLDRQFKQEAVDWHNDYALPLQRGVDTFGVFVDVWYDGRFQDVIFHQNQQSVVKAMICLMLAGYAWDEANPYVKKARSRLDTLVELCRAN